MSEYLFDPSPNENYEPQQISKPKKTKKNSQKKKSNTRFEKTSPKSSFVSRTLVDTYAKPFIDETLDQYSGSIFCGKLLVLFFVVSLVYLIHKSLSLEKEIAKIKRK